MEALGTSLTQGAQHLTALFCCVLAELFLPVFRAAFLLPGETLSHLFSSYRDLKEYKSPLLSENSQKRLQNYGTTDQTLPTFPQKRVLPAPVHTCIFGWKLSGDAFLDFLTLESHPGAFPSSPPPFLCVSGLDGTLSTRGPAPQWPHQAETQISASSSPHQRSFFL